jgi:hypothetical protein
MSRIRFTYKFVIQKTKRFFLEFLKYWPSSHGLNKLVIKAKMHANTYIVLKFSLLCENMMLQYLYIYIGETRPYFKTKHFLKICIFVRFDANRVF